MLSFLNNYEKGVKNMSNKFSSATHLIANKNAKPCDCILYRKFFELNSFDSAELLLLNNGLCAVYLNGLPVIKTESSFTGNKRCFSKVDATDFLMPGENVIAIMVYPLSNTDKLPHCSVAAELTVDGNTALSSDGSFLTSKHHGFVSENCFDGRCDEIEFEYPDYDDTDWEAAVEVNTNITDAVCRPTPRDEQPVKPISIKKDGSALLVNFDRMYNGCLYVEAEGKQEDKINFFISNGEAEKNYKWILKDGFNMLSSFVPMNISKCRITVDKGATVDTESITLLTK